MSTTVRFSIGQLLGMDDTIGDLLAGDLQHSSRWPMMVVTGAKHRGCVAQKNNMWNVGIPNWMLLEDPEFGVVTSSTISIPGNKNDPPVDSNLFFPHITVWGSCFSLGSRRSPPLPHPASPPHHHLTSLITSWSSHHNSSQLHFSHLTYHISHHISLITPQLITAPLLTSHSSHQCGRRSTQSLLAELRRVWPPLGPRLAFVWQAQYTEPPGGAAARVAAAWPRLAFMWLHRASAAHVAAAWAAPGFRVTGAVHIASWRSCARGRRWAAAGFHLISSHLISSCLISSHLISSLSPSLA